MRFTSTVFIALFLALLMLLCSPGEAADGESMRTEAFVGYAYQIDSGELVYSEHHRRQWDGADPVSMRTSYRLANGETFATREVDYRSGGVVTFELSDTRIGYREGARLEDEQLELFVRRTPDRPTKSETINIADDLIVDAGFDSFVRKHFDALKAGESVRARFAVPSRQASYDCEITRLSEGSIDGEPTVTLRMAFKGFLLSLFADPVDVTYHRDTGELLRYEGVSNLRDESGDNYEVRIELPLDERSQNESGENA